MYVCVCALSPHFVFYLPTCIIYIGAQIPLSGGVESLNAAAAGAIILSEAARQRRRKK